MERFYSRLYLFSFHPFRAALIARRCLTRSLVARPLWPHTHKKKPTGKTRLSKSSSPDQSLRIRCCVRADLSANSLRALITHGQYPVSVLGQHQHADSACEIESLPELRCIIVPIYYVATSAFALWFALLSDDCFGASLRGRWMDLSFYCSPPINLAWGSIALA